jgi:hypothetical protein
MTLKEKFLKASVIEGIADNSEVIAATNATIADDFAIDFAEWIDINYFVYNTWDKDVSIKELLEIYKKEKGL